MSELAKTWDELCKKYCLHSDSASAIDAIIQMERDHYDDALIEITGLKATIERLEAEISDLNKELLEFTHPYRW